MVTISPTGTSCMTTFKIPIRWKLAVDDKIIQQEIKFKYLEVEISGHGDTETEVRNQSTKATRRAAYLNNTI